MRSILLTLWLIIFGCLDVFGQPVIQPATQAEVNAGILHTKFVAPDTLKNWSGAGGGSGQNFTNVTTWSSDGIIPAVVANGPIVGNGTTNYFGNSIGANTFIYMLTDGQGIRFGSGKVGIYGSSSGDGQFILHDYSAGGDVITYVNNGDGFTSTYGVKLPLSGALVFSAQSASGGSGNTIIREGGNGNEIVHSSNAGDGTGYTDISTATGDLSIELNVGTACCGFLGRQMDIRVPGMGGVTPAFLSGTNDGNGVAVTAISDGAGNFGIGVTNGAVSVTNFTFLGDSTGNFGSSGKTLTVNGSGKVVWAIVGGGTGLAFTNATFWTGTGGANNVADFSGGNCWLYNPSDNFVTVDAGLQMLQYNQVKSLGWRERKFYDSSQNVTGNYDTRGLTNTWTADSPPTATNGLARRWETTNAVFYKATGTPGFVGNGSGLTFGGFAAPIMLAGATNGTGITSVDIQFVSVGTTNYTPYVSGGLVYSAKTMTSFHATIPITTGNVDWSLVTHNASVP